LEIPAVVETGPAASRGVVEETDGGFCELSRCPAVTVGARYSTALTTIETATRYREVQDRLVLEKAFFIRLSNWFHSYV
jgi:hypothetical protein